MLTNKKTFEKLKREIGSKKFIAHPERILSWFGGVTYENLEKTIEGIKKLLSQNTEQEVCLLINSYGGVTGIAMSFFDFVNSLFNLKLVTVGSGDVDSSGIIVFLAGRERILTKNTTMLLHLAGRTFDQSKRFSTADMENMLKEDKLKDYQYASLLAEATGDKYSTEHILGLMAQSTILTAEEALHMGLAHRII